MPRVYDAVKIGSMLAPNRFSYEPLSTHCCDPRGYVNDRILEQCRRIAAGGYGLFHTGAVAVHPQGQIFRPQLALWDESYIDGLYELSEAVKREGPRVGIQLCHGGIVANPRYMVFLPEEKRVPLGPSPVPADPRTVYHGTACREMSVNEIEETLQAFAQAALWAKEAGFDFIQLHACHQSLPMQFLSPRWNRRTDEWGQSKLLYLERTYQAIRTAVGVEFPLTIRASASEMPRAGEENPGYNEEYFYNVIAPAIEKMGWNALDVSTGGHASSSAQVGMGMPLYADQAWAMRFARETKKRQPQMLVGCVGKIMDARMAEKIVEEGWADIVGIGRPALADPDYPWKAREGRYEDIRQCIGCDRCWVGVYYAGPTECAVNFVFSREYKGMEKLEKAEKPKKIVIVGGGVAGLEFARLAYLRGHEVAIYEKKNELGGMVNVASDIPYAYTMDLAHIVVWLRSQIEKLGIEVHLGEEVTASTIERLHPDVVVVAAGSVSEVPEVPGINSPQVITVDNYLWEKPEIEGKAVVYGSYEGAEIALSLAESGAETVLVSETENKFAAPYFHNVPQRLVLLEQKLSESRVEIITGARLNSVNKDGVEITDARGETRTIPADIVVIGCGRNPSNELSQSLQGKVPELYCIGDCVQPGSVYHSVYDANYLARKV